MVASTDVTELPTTVGDAIAQFLEAQDIAAVFGVISIHNMPILDAIGRRNNLRFVPSRGEAGAVNMADACARVSGRLSVAFTSTGTGAGNAAGALVEAYTAGSPILHITGQIETEFLDRDLGFIHEAPAQLDMLKSVSKTAYRVDNVHQLTEVLERAVNEALTAPMGPVSVEIPVDVQSSQHNSNTRFARCEPPRLAASGKDVAEVALELAQVRRPIILLGGGARLAADAATALADRGIGIVTSTNGRAIVPENHPMSLGAFNLSTHIQSLYDNSDLLLVVGSRLRSNETWSYELALPKNLIRIDCDSAADSRSYSNAKFVHADCTDFLEKLVERLPSELSIDEGFASDIDTVRKASINQLRSDLGPYAAIVDALQTAMPTDAVWVRDVTISNSMWGNRMLQISEPNKGVHALGGGIGQGVPMAIGAACAASGAKTILLTGDGGLSLCLGELITAVEQNINATMILMNDRGYGVIRNIQDAQYDGRKFYSDIYTPDFSKIAQGIGVRHAIADSIHSFETSLNEALSFEGFAIVEVDMLSIGPFERGFAGPPQKS